jgi:tripartite-type tricarboxylate transporter receptor subunit TctC
VVVPFAAGGVDLPMRLIAQRLSERLGQQFFIENVGGGGGSIGTAKVARATPDGYTILFTASAFVMFPALHEKLPYNPLKDFAPVTGAATSSMVLLTNPSLPVRSVAELIAFTKASPGKYSYASAGVGTPPHLTGELFRQSQGLDLVHVPYHSGGEAIEAVIAGHTQLCFAAIAPAVAQIKAEKLRALAVAAKDRLRALPGTPTMTEAGYPGVEGEVWCGVLAPAGTPQQIVTFLRTQIASVLNDRDAQMQLDKIGYVPVGSTPDDFARQIASELDKWRKVARAAHIDAG